MKVVYLSTLTVGVLALSSCFKRSEAVRIPKIQDAPQFVSVKHLAFQGTVHSSFSGSYSWKGATTGPGKTTASQPKKWRFVVPVTGADWDQSQPVPLWVTFSSVKKNQQPEIAAFRQAIARGEVAGVNVDFPERTTGLMRGKSAWQQAVADAVQRHGLVTDPRAPIVSWRP
ncbi:MAG: hypothetical protein P1U68_07745 [Verrucomicrobiales bacterium]|nr:hypothetical protein [Verrucomicrobiales bacterium]